MAIHPNILALAVVLLSASLAAAQQPPSCASKLVPCASYLNSTKPPESCCGPLKDAVRNELPCLCSIFKAPDLLKAFSINLTEALQLPKNCGIKSDQNLCSNTSATPPSSSNSPSAAGVGGSATGGSGSSSTGKNNTSGAFGGPTILMAMSGLVTMSLFTWSVTAL